MKKLESLVNINQMIYSLFKKIYEKKNQDCSLYYSLLEDVFVKEEELINNITFEELEELKTELSKKYQLSFENNVWLEIINSNVSEEILRTYKELFYLNEFYKTQDKSKLTINEARTLIGKPYVDGLLAKRKMEKDILWNVCKNYVNLNSTQNEWECYKYCYLFSSEDSSIESFINCENEIVPFQKENYKKNWEILLEIINQDFMRVLEEVLTTSISNPTYEAKINLFKAYLGIMGTYSNLLLDNYMTTPFLNEINCKSLEKVNEHLKFLDIPALPYKESIVLKEKKIEQEEKKIYSYEQIESYEDYFHKCCDFSYKIHEAYQKILLGKKQNEPFFVLQEYAKQLDDLLMKEEKFYSTIPDFSSFKEYIQSAYSTYVIYDSVLPFSILDISFSSMLKATLEDYENIKKLIYARTLNNMYNFSINKKWNKLKSMPELDLMLVMISEQFPILPVSYFNELINYNNSHENEFLTIEMVHNLCFLINKLMEEFLANNLNFEKISIGNTSNTTQYDEYMYIILELCENVYYDLCQRDDECSKTIFKIFLSACCKTLKKEDGDALQEYFQNELKNVNANRAKKKKF